MNEVTKAIIPIAGRGVRFLPLSKVIPKELFPLVDLPLIQYAILEAKQAGVKEIIIVSNGTKRGVEEYIKPIPELVELLQEKGEKSLAKELKDLDSLCGDITFSFVSDTTYKGDGSAILRAAKKVGDNPCYIFFPDDIIEAKKPASLQLLQAFKTAKQPIIGLASVAQELLPLYGVVKGMKITNRVYKLQEIIEKPALGSAPSNLAVVGRSIITPEVFVALAKRKARATGKHKEVRLTEAMADMVQSGKVVYGYEFQGRWWSCGTKQSWIRSFLYFALQHPEYGKELRAFIKKEKLI